MSEMSDRVAVLEKLVDRLKMLMLFVGATATGVGAFSYWVFRQQAAIDMTVAAGEARLKTLAQVGATAITDAQAAALSNIAAQASQRVDGAVKPVFNAWLSDAEGRWEAELIERRKNEKDYADALYALVTNATNSPALASKRFNCAAGRTVPIAQRSAQLKAELAGCP